VIRINLTIDDEAYPDLHRRLEGMRPRQRAIWMKTKLEWLASGEVVAASPGLQPMPPDTTHALTEPDDPQSLSHEEIVASVFCDALFGEDATTSSS